MSAIAFMILMYFAEPRIVFPWWLWVIVLLLSVMNAAMKNER